MMIVSNNRPTVKRVYLVSILLLLVDYLVVLENLNQLVQLTIESRPGSYTRDHESF